MKEVAALIVALLAVPAHAVHAQATEDVKLVTEKGVTPPTVIQEVKPQYTRSAMNAKIQGVVLLQVVVQRNGLVGEVKVVRSLDASLDDEAVKSVKRWRFNPATKDGEPVAVLVTVEMAFTLRPEAFAAAPAGVPPMSLPAEFTSAGAESSLADWTSTTRRTSGMSVTIRHPSNWMRKPAVDGHLIALQNGRHVANVGEATPAAMPLAEPLAEDRLATLMNLIRQQTGYDIARYGQGRVNGRLWVWFESFWPMPAEAGLPFDGSRSWMFIATEGNYQLSASFYVLHLRNEPDARMSDEVARAAPVFMDMLKSIRIE